MNFNEGAFIYINKPYRMTSFGALAHIRYVVSKRLHVKRVKMGHAGTLDPLATGVLILCTGKATKQIESLQLHTKEYTATLQLGATTASYDMEHEVDSTYPTEHITRELILDTLPRFMGDIMQVPPAFSAVTVPTNLPVRGRRWLLLRSLCVSMRLNSRLLTPRRCRCLSAWSAAKVLISVHWPVTSARLWGVALT